MAAAAAAAAAAAVVAPATAAAASTASRGARGPGAARGRRCRRPACGGAALKMSGRGAAHSQTGNDRGQTRRRGGASVRRAVHSPRKRGVNRRARRKRRAGHPRGSHHERVRAGGEARWDRVRRTPVHTPARGVNGSRGPPPPPPGPRRPGTPPRARGDRGGTSGSGPRKKSSPRLPNRHSLKESTLGSRVSQRTAQRASCCSRGLVARRGHVVAARAARAT